MIDNLQFISVGKVANYAYSPSKLSPALSEITFEVGDYRENPLEDDADAA